MNNNYDGYLKPYLPRIKTLAKQRLNPNQIARQLYSEGARPLYNSYHGERGDIATMGGIVRFILFKKAPEIKRARHRVKWARQELRKAERALAWALAEREKYERPGRT
jgi:hypothetical protein